MLAVIFYDAAVVEVTGVEVIADAMPMVELASNDVIVEVSMDVADLELLELSLFPLAGNTFCLKKNPGSLSSLLTNTTFPTHKIVNIYIRDTITLAFFNHSVIKLTHRVGSR